ncbi:MAG: ABC transporter ATP-binding protein [Pseudomonadota bacterium]
MTELVAEGICVDAGERHLVKTASFRLSPRELVAIVGPNGAGKTSLLRAALGLVSPSSGQASLNGVNVHDLSAMDRARQVAYLPQTRPLAWPSRVRDIVALGRFSHGAAPGRLKGADAEAVDRALKAADLTERADRTSDTLSGGELARMHFARAVATEAPLLIADEPVAALDPRHQFRTLDLIQDFVARGGGALVVLHDLNLAARYASRLIWMQDGAIIADGAPGKTLTPERIRTVFGLNAQISPEGVLLTPP